jgi:hypothetical protein
VGSRPIVSIVVSAADQGKRANSFGLRPDDRTSVEHPDIEVPLRRYGPEPEWSATQEGRKFALVRDTVKA